MCGIVGYITNNKKFEGSSYLRDYFRQALFVDTLRGKDSTGIFAAPHDNLGRVNYFKRPVEAMDFLQMKIPSDIINRSNNFLIGHNRAATQGKVNGPNSHPFVHGNIIGIHNGTLRADDGLIDRNKFDVDSEALIYTLSEKPSEEVIPEILGAFALIWYDIEEEKLHIVRNDERTLYFGKVEFPSWNNQGVSNTAYLIASERGMLKWVANRNGMKVKALSDFAVGKEYIIDPMDPEKFVTKKHKLRKDEPPKPYVYGSNTRALPNRHDKRNAELNSWGLSKYERVGFYLTKFYPYSANPRVNPPRYTYGFAEGYMMCEPFGKVMIHGLSQEQYALYDGKFSLRGFPVSANTTGPVHHEKVTVIIDSNRIEVDKEEESSYHDEDGRVISYQRWLQITKGGCGNCTTDFHYDKDVFWTDTGHPLCEDCANLFAKAG